jgi:hypothetical protein
VNKSRFYQPSQLLRKHLPQCRGIDMAFYGTIWLATRGKQDTRMAEQVRKIRRQVIPECIQGLCYNSGIYFEVPIYLTAQSAPKVVAESVVSWTRLRPLTFIL